MRNGGGGEGLFGKGKVSTHGIQRTSMLRSGGGKRALTSLSLSPSLLTLSSPIFSFTDSHSFPPSPLSLVSLSLPLALKMLLEIMLRFIILRKYFTASVIFLWEEEGRIYECDNQNVKTLLCMKMHAFPQNDEVRDAISLSWPSIREGRSTFEYCFFPQLQVCWSGQMTEVASF